MAPTSRAMDALANAWRQAPRRASAGARPWPHPGRLAGEPCQLEVRLWISASRRVVVDGRRRPRTRFAHPRATIGPDSVFVHISVARGVECHRFVDENRVRMCEFGGGRPDQITAFDQPGRSV